MRCRICGAKLRNEGDICNSCYKLYQEEENLKKDVTEKLVVKRKYSIAYNLARYFWIFIVFIFSVVICLTGKEFLPVLGLIGALIVVIGLLLFLDKRLAKATKAVFYEKKVVYTFDFLFIHTEKMVKYEDIRDITIYPPTLWQRKYNLGDICVYAKGVFPGASLLNGFQVKNVENASEVLDKIGEVVGPLKK